MYIGFCYLVNMRYGSVVPLVVHVRSSISTPMYPSYLPIINGGRRKIAKDAFIPAITPCDHTKTLYALYVFLM